MRGTGPPVLFNIIKDGQIIGTEATKADGSITVTDVTVGMYAFAEVSAPAPYATLTELAATANAPATYRATPRSVPLLFISGDADPVGTNGKGVAQAAASMKQAGHENVTLKLYKAMRHEILNEIGKEDVYNDILQWIEQHNHGKA